MEAKLVTAVREAINLNRELTAILADERVFLGGLEDARYASLVSRRQTMENRIDTVHTEVAEQLFRYAGIHGFECLCSDEIQNLLDELRSSIQETAVAVNETVEATRCERNVVAHQLDETGKRGKQAVRAYRSA